MNKNKKIILAVGIAATADAIQLGLGLAQLSGVLFIPAEFLDVMMDFAVAGIMCYLIGFHWLLLPTVFAEFIPILSMFPTWTGCTLLVIGQKRNAQIQKTLVAEVEQLKAATPPPFPNLAVNTLRQIPPPIPVTTEMLLLPLKSANGIEQTCKMRLQRAQDLFDNKLISQAQLDAKREQILSEI